MRLSEEQATVVRSDLQRFSVRAAAGSGKTSVLVDRYLRHVLELGYSPEEIVTLTFTRKAAAEMKQRIVNRLRTAGDLAGAQVAETGPIQTIHSYCERILRENAVEAEVDPEFEIIHGSQSSGLVEQAVTQAFLEARDENPWAAEFVHRYAGRSTYRSSFGTHGQLREVVGSLLDKFRSSGLSPLALADLYSSPQKTVEFWASEALRELPEGVANPMDVHLETWGPDLLSSLKTLGCPAPGWAKNLSPTIDLESAEDTCGLVWLTLFAWQWLEAEMNDRQEFDFSLLESKAVRLLEQSGATRDRIRRQARLVLVDEAQDLSPLQYRIIDRLDAPGEMMVGDPRQSIYGFRFADRRLFIDRCDQVTTFDLSYNYRSEPGILDFVETVFAQMTDFQVKRVKPALAEGDDPFGEDSPSDFQGIELWPLAAKDTASVAALVQQLVQEGAAPKDIAVLVRGNRMLNLLAGRFKQIGLPVRTVGSSEKFYVRLEVRDLANALEALSDQREDFPLLALLHSPFVGLSIDATTYLAAQKPVLEALAKQGPWSKEDQAKLDSFRKWFDVARTSVDRVPAWETISFLFRETPYLEGLARSPGARQSLANVRKLLAIAAAEPELNARDFAMRLREIQFLKHQEGDAPLVDEQDNAISLMTVHKSKGLEFPIVVLPDTHSPLEKSKSTVQSDVNRGLVIAGMRKKNTAYFHWLRDKVSEREKSEEMRVLYVAMTRAQKRLCIVTAEDSSDDRPAHLIAKRAGLPKEVLPGIKVRRLESP